MYNNLKNKFLTYGNLLYMDSNAINVVRISASKNKLGNYMHQENLLLQRIC